MNDVMLDLETMGQGPNAAVVAIGAVAMDLEKGTLGTQFFRIVNLESSVAAGGELDPSTVLWWLRQAEEARMIFRKDASTVSISEALLAFSAYLSTQGPHVKVWGNGASFDNVILRRAYQRLGLHEPWPYWDDRCYRTMKGLHPKIGMDREGVHHDALCDAVSQAKHLLKIQA